MEALVLLSVSKKHRYGRVAPTMGEGIEDPQTERARPQKHTARGGPTSDLGSHSLGVPSPLRVECLLPRPAPHLLRRLRVKVRLQQRDRELDLPGTVVWLHGWAAAAGPALRRAGRRRDSGLGRARSLSAPLSSGRGPSPARSAPGSQLPARRSQLSAPGILRPPIGSARIPHGPPSSTSPES